MGIGLAAAIACRSHAHQPGVQPVLKETRQNAVFDQSRAPSRRAFVVDCEAAAPIEHRAIIHHRHPARGDALAQQTGESGSTLAVEIPFQPVADRLVQKNAWPARAKHHFHFAGRRGPAVEIDDCLAQRLLHPRAPGFGRT